MLAGKNRRTNVFLFLGLFTFCFLFCIGKTTIHTVKDILMKKAFILLIITIFIASACHKKAVPTFTTRSIDISQTASTNTTPDIEAGKNTFTARCIRCHNLPDPGKYNVQRWNGILTIMTFRARLTKEEINDVTGYIKANCAK